MGRHKQEPWEVLNSNNSNLVHVQTGEESGVWGEQIATCNAGDREQRNANADRIVLCVNAMSGISRAKPGSVRRLVEAAKSALWPNSPSADDMALLVAMCAGNGERHAEAMSLVNAFRKATEEMRAALAEIELEQENAK